jgi:small subunit ribosomal protein S21
MGGSHDDEQEHHRHHYFHQEARDEAVLARRMRLIIGHKKQVRRWTLPPLSDTCARSRLRLGLSPAVRFTRISIRAIERGCRVQVLVRDNNVDQALRVLKKKMQREGIFREMKLRRHYEKPSEKKAREKAEAVRRARKLARKKLQREGLLPMKPKPVFGAGPGADRGGPGGGRGGAGPRGPR